MVGVELLSIDADTSARQFAKEVRWGNAYWHLAGAV
jgi:L-arabinose isomerase